MIMYVLPSRAACRFSTAHCRWGYYFWLDPKVAKDQATTIPATAQAAPGRVLWRPRALFPCCFYIVLIARDKAISASNRNAWRGLPRCYRSSQ